MNKTTKSALLMLIVALFLLTTPLIILYSQGYRFDFETKSFFQTGSFSFKAWPRGSLVSIDNKLEKKTDFLFGTIYIENLLPKKYNIEIRKDGYYSWKKDLKIKEGEVTESKNIFLIPKNPQFNSLEIKVDNFFPSPDGKKAILKINEEENWSLASLDLKNNTPSLFFETENFLEIYRKSDFVNLEWSLDSKRFLLKTETEKNQYFVVEIENGLSIFPLDFLIIDVDKVSFHPQNPQVVLLTRNLKEDRSIFSVNYKEKSFPNLILNNFLAFNIFNNHLFWLDNKGFIHQSNLSGKENILINREHFSLDSNPQIELIAFSDNKFSLNIEGKLYFFDRERQSFEKISNGVKEIKISPDSKKVAYYTNHEIWLLFLDKIEEQPKREKGDRVFLTRFSEEISDIFWYTGHYLIFSANNEIKVIEIDDRDKVNIYTLVEFKSPEIFWNEYNRKLYVLDEKRIIVSESLIP